MGFSRRMLMLSPLAASFPLRAQTRFPDRAIRVVIGYPAGGGTDVVGRPIMQRLSEQLARIIHQELADVVYSFEISYDFAAESQNPRIQRPHPPWWKLPHLCPACHLFLARR